MKKVSVVPARSNIPQIVCIIIIIEVLIIKSNSRILISTAKNATTRYILPNFFALDSIEEGSDVR